MSGASVNQLLGYIREAVDAVDHPRELDDHEHFVVKRGIAAASMLANRASSEELKGLAEEMKKEYFGYCEEQRKRELIPWQLFS